MEFGENDGNVVGHGAKIIQHEPGEAGFTREEMERAARGARSGVGSRNL